MPSSADTHSNIDLHGFPPQQLGNVLLGDHLEGAIANYQSFLDELQLTEFTIPQGWQFLRAFGRIPPTLKIRQELLANKKAALAELPLKAAAIKECTLLVNNLIDFLERQARQQLLSEDELSTLLTFSQTAGTELSKALLDPALMTADNHTNYVQNYTERDRTYKELATSLDTRKQRVIALKTQTEALLQELLGKREFLGDFLTQEPSTNTEPQNLVQQIRKKFAEIATLANPNLTAVYTPIPTPTTNEIETARIQRVKDCYSGIEQAYAELIESIAQNAHPQLVALTDEVQQKLRELTQLEQDLQQHQEQLAQKQQILTQTRKAARERYGELLRQEQLQTAQVSAQEPADTPPPLPAPTAAIPRKDAPASPPPLTPQAAPQPKERHPFIAWLIRVGTKIKEKFLACFSCCCRKKPAQDDEIPLLEPSSRYKAVSERLGATGMPSVSSATPAAATVSLASSIHSVRASAMLRFSTRWAGPPAAMPPSSDEDEVRRLMRQFFGSSC